MRWCNHDTGYVRVTTFRCSVLSANSSPPFSPSLQIPRRLSRIQWNRKTTSFCQSGPSGESHLPVSSTPFECSRCQFILHPQEIDEGAYLIWCTRCNIVELVRHVDAPSDDAPGHDDRMELELVYSVGPSRFRRLAWEKTGE